MKAEEKELEIATLSSVKEKVVVAKVAAEKRLETHLTKQTTKTKIRNFEINFG